MEVVLLSQHPELKEETALLLNSEWKRSASARSYLVISQIFKIHKISKSQN